MPQDTIEIEERLVPKTLRASITVGEGQNVETADPETYNKILRRLQNTIPPGFEADYHIAASVTYRRKGGAR